MLVCVITVTMCASSLAKQLPSNGHLFFSLQLHDAYKFLMCAFSDFPIVVFYYMFSVSCVIIAKFDTVLVDDFA